MQFTSSATSYDRFMGRYTATLAPAFADAAGVVSGMRVVDVGCGPGGLTGELARRTGADLVAAIDPAPQFAAACRERNPGADVREGVAESLPWPDDSFDAALCCLVVAFMRDPDQGIREMARVTRPGGTVAACMWDIPGGGMTMLSTFWATARELDPQVRGEHQRAGVTKGDLGERLRRAGLQDVEEDVVEAHADYADFDDFWQPFTHSVGPSGEYLKSLSAADAARLRDAVRAKLPDGAFSLTARAWFARGTPGA
jgi:ubiquinone/menaquinone biosynthesis C-methylase UbiE